MNLHVKFVILVVGIVALAGLVMLLRTDAVMRRDSTLTFDAFFVLLGAGLIGVIFSYVRARRRGVALAADGQSAGAGPARAPAIERLLGKKRSRIVDLVVLGLISVAVLFLVVLFAYMLYLHLLR
jgi:hypothetical protein